jgi:hypothetical protein
LVFAFISVDLCSSVDSIFAARGLVGLTNS